MGLVPLAFPSVLETIQPGLVGRLMGPVERFLEQYGRWVVIVICFYVSFQLWRHAFAVLP